MRPRRCWIGLAPPCDREAVLTGRLLEHPGPINPRAQRARVVVRPDGAPAGRDRDRGGRVQRRSLTRLSLVSTGTKEAAPKSGFKSNGDHRSMRKPRGQTVLRRADGQRNGPDGGEAVRMCRVIPRPPASPLQRIRGRINWPRPTIVREDAHRKADDASARCRRHDTGCPKRSAH